jgi:hypothetical protein
MERGTVLAVDVPCPGRFVREIIGKMNNNGPVPVYEKTRTEQVACLVLFNGRLSLSNFGLLSSVDKNGNGVR